MLKSQTLFRYCSINAIDLATIKPSLYGSMFYSAKDTLQSLSPGLLRYSCITENVLPSGSVIVLSIFGLAGRSRAISDSSLVTYALASCTNPLKSIYTL